MTEKITIETLTEATIDGNGAFDVLMRAAKAHLEQEYGKNRIKGAEYSTVYLGSLQTVLATALEFVAQKQNIELEAQLLEHKIALAQAEVEKTQAEIQLVIAQTEKALAEKDLLEQNADKVAAEIRNLDANTAHIEGQTTKIPLEISHLQAQIQLTEQEVRNAATHNDTMLKEQCKLDAEFDVLRSTDIKIAAETSLLNQRTATERAQTVGMGVDEDSVIGRQKALYVAQTEGFKRDAEQSAAKILADSWSVRRSTDEATSANSTNKLDDATIGRAITKLLAGVGA